MNRISEIPAQPFYFIRHGETDWNLKKMVMGSTDIDLNQTGIDQATEAAYIIQNIELSKIYSSPLKRAYKTSEIISSICGLDIEVMPELKERHWGVAQGKNNDNTLSPLTNDNLPQDAEDFINFENRIVQTLQKMLNSIDKYPLIVSHGGVFKVLAKILANRTDIQSPNCKVFFFNPPSITKEWDINEV